MSLFLHSSLAKAFCSDVFARVATENIQLHGGLGFTWEHPAQLYCRRAKAGEAILGTANMHQELIAAQLPL